MTYTLIDIYQHSNSDILFKVLKSDTQRFWPSNKVFETLDGGTYKLSHSILAVLDPETKDLTYKVISNNILARTALSDVYPIEFTFRFTRNLGLRKIATAPEVLKSVKHLAEQTRSEFKSLVSSEYQQTRNIAHLKMQAPILLSKQALMLMRRVPGVELFAFIKVVYDNRIKLPIKFLFMLSDAILQAFYKQVVAYKITHKDLKPENMLIDTDYGEELLRVPAKDLEVYTPSRVVINYIDYSYARPFGYFQRHNGGTLGYCAPEYRKAIFSDEKYDIYAIGIILQMIWGMFEYKNTATRTLSGERLLNLEVAEKIYEESFATRHNDLSYATYLRLCIMMINMVNTNPALRWSLPETESTFEKIVIASEVSAKDIFNVTRDYWEERPREYIPDLQNLHRAGIIGFFWLISTNILNAIRVSAASFFSFSIFTRESNQDNFDDNEQEGLLRLYIDTVCRESMVSFTGYTPELENFVKSDLGVAPRVAKRNGFFNGFDLAEREEDLLSPALIEAEHNVFSH